MPVYENCVPARHISAVPSKCYRVIFVPNVRVQDCAVVDGPPVPGSVVLQTASPGPYLLRKQNARGNQPDQIGVDHRIHLECYTLGR